MKIGIIGYGKLGNAVSRSIIKLNKGSNLITSSVHSNIAIAKECDDVFLCVKPNDAKIVCEEIKGHIKYNTVVISVMAGVPYSKLQEWLNYEYVVKTMPTISLPKGPVVVYNPLNLKFQRFSKNYLHVEDENIVDMSTGISGCIPGFLANVLEQWIQAGMKLGMDRKYVEKLVCLNASAFADFNAKSIGDLEDIQEAVASKGGATEKGLIYMNESNLQQILKDTMKISNDRVLELAKTLRE
jgi:pyrroline-5-carboxylate reductase